MGGPEVRNRKVLAISSSMRNVGVCLAIASDYFAGTDVSVPIPASSGIMIPMNRVFALVAGRIARGEEETAKATRRKGEQKNILLRGFSTRSGNCLDLFF
jgi:hypothetical protein